MGKAPQRKKKQGRKRRAGAGNVFAASGPSCMLPSPTRQVYHFERTLYMGPMANPVADKGWSWNFTLGQFPGATEFTQLFDLYKMTTLEITFSVAGTSGGGWDPTLSMLADYDSYTTPTSIDAVAQRPHKRVTLSAAHPTYTFKLKPRVMTIVQTSSGTGSAGLAPAGQWLDCNESTVVYGGLLGWIANFNVGTALLINVTVRAKFDFAMVR